MLSQEVEVEVEVVTSQNLIFVVDDMDVNVISIRN